MRCSQLRVYHGVDYFNISPLGLDFNTSGNILPMIFWFVDSSIHYTLITLFSLESVWFNTCFTLDIVNVVHCSSIWQYGAHALWLTVRNVLHHMVLKSIFLFCILQQLYYYFLRQKIDINLGQPTLHKLYTHMPPQTPIFNCWWSIDL